MELENGLKAFRDALRAAGGALRAALAGEHEMRGRIGIESVPLPAGSLSPELSPQFGYNALAICNRAFVAVDTHSSSAFDEPILPAQNQHLLPATLLYNLGLCYHIDGMRTGTSTQMLKAYQYYRHSFSFLERAPERLEGKQEVLLVQQHGPPKL